MSPRPSSSQGTLDECVYTYIHFQLTVTLRRPIVLNDCTQTAFGLQYSAITQGIDQFSKSSHYDCVTNNAILAVVFLHLQNDTMLEALGRGWRGRVCRMIT